MKQGLLLFAHGARDSRWALPFEDIAERIRARAPNLPVELAFLEFMRPDLLEGGRRLAAAQCERVDVVPLFLGAGGHVRKDIPELLIQLESAHPAVHWELRPAIGEVDSVVEAMAMAALAWLQPLQAPTPL
ncbi:CbiX/SirB N-terminal domain-containing protein [Piscinibacter sp. XHJ-5]|uniref:sirohydrochlorin chelatase n=1 Tax=Piscinibacter sp. XHJ-5 TaxID=3037797 RepID=UPI0024536F36|nr:CbiX/SirB N-terminal domain-containing protein [Piscinibacter sp. XHJ-5]